MKRIYSYQSYKKFIKDVSLLHGRGSIARIAEAAGCNRTYLSQALASKVQLTPDHILGISEYLDLSDDEQEFFILLNLCERSASKKAQLKMKQKMEKLIQSDLVLSKKIAQKSDSQELSEKQKTKYYSSWKYAAIHTLTSIKDYQQISTLCKKTRLSENETSLVLKELEEMGLIQSLGGKWTHSGKNIHVPVGSSYTTQNHLNWRLKSVEDVNNKSSVHYTNLFSISKPDWEPLREQILRFIEKQRDTIHSSGAEEMYCFSCDLFQPCD